MANFCGKCGAPLPENGICKCQEQNQQNQQETQFQYAQPSVQPKNNDVGKYFLGLWNWFIRIFKAPVSEGTEFVKTCDYKSALGLIGVKALAIALLFMTLASKINSATSGKLTSSKSIIEFPLFKVFILSGIVAFALACLMPAALMLFIRMFKHQATYKNMLCLSGIVSIFRTPFVLLALFICLLKNIDATTIIYSGLSSILSTFLVPLLISFAGIFIAYFAVLKTVNGGSDIDDNHSVYVMFFTVVVMAVALYIAIKIAAPMCTPSIDKSLKSIFD